MAKNNQAPVKNADANTKATVTPENTGTNTSVTTDVAASIETKTDENTADVNATENNGTDASVTTDVAASTETKNDEKAADKKGGKKAETTVSENLLVAQAKSAAKHYPTEKDLIVTEDGSVFLSKERNSAEFHAKNKKVKVFVYNVANATLKEV